ncbi:hypothetical protein SteCoe_29126 [Stentor coeruleus]|uniref:Uncharacterized protein n=1 Tax=Stentor coeruleus TaxID=5963 RepID=A0A1R2B6L1_9CILI|nr:hypothetical protein SteCoe_29126 [Stentor coeruleus]
MATEEVQFSRLKASGIGKKVSRPPSKVDNILRRLSVIKNSLDKNWTRLDKLNSGCDASASEHLINSLKEKKSILDQINAVKRTFAEEYIKSLEEGLNISDQIQSLLEVLETEGSMIDSKLKTLDILIEKKAHLEAATENLRAQYLENIKEEANLKRSIDFHRGKIIQCLIEKNAIMKFEGEKEIKEIEEKLKIIDRPQPKKVVFEFNVQENNQGLILFPLLGIVFILGLIKIFLLNSQ